MEALPLFVKYLFKSIELDYVLKNFNALLFDNHIKKSVKRIPKNSYVIRISKLVRNTLKKTKFQFHSFQSRSFHFVLYSMDVLF